MGILMGSAAELWEFSKPESDISKRLEDSVKTVLNHGARITYVASIDDQLVPMEVVLSSVHCLKVGNMLTNNLFSSLPSILRSIIHTSIGLSLSMAVFMLQTCTYCSVIVFTLPRGISNLLGTDDTIFL